MLFPQIVNVLHEIGQIQNNYLTSTVDTDGLVLKHQVISSYSTDNTPMCFQQIEG